MAAAAAESANGSVANRRNHLGSDGSTSSSSSGGGGGEGIPPLILNGAEQVAEEVAEMANGDVFVDESSNPTTPTSLDSSSNSLQLPRRSSIIKEGSRRHTRKKTVSFTAMPEEKKIANASDCITFMQTGCELIKVRSQSRQYHRIFTLDEDLAYLHWHPTSKKPNKAKISIDSIKEVRPGKNTETFRNREIAGEFSEDCAFSIIYGEHYDSLDLVASTPDEANIWVTGLTCLIGNNKAQENGEKKNSNEMDMRDRWLKEMFDMAAADTETSGLLDEFEIISLVKKLNSSISSSRVRQKFKEVITLKNDGKEEGTKHISFAEFLEFFKEIATRPDIYFLLVRYASGEYLTKDDLLIFLEAEQGMVGITKEKCTEIIHKYEPSSEGLAKGHLGIDGFTKYLLSEECDIFDPLHKTVSQDMSQPLSHYFIASSHNTYLTEDQLKGPSSTQGYIYALLKGCRWVEMDCWDGSNGEPIVYHGHTLTSKISALSVIEAINEYAFKTSEYPVILSIENHCSVPQQKLLAKTITSILDDKLYSSPADKEKNFLPSPADLKGKILIKGKKFSGDKTIDEGEVTEEDEGADTDKKKMKREGLKKIKLSRELSELVNVCKSIRFEDFHESSQRQKYWEICSFSDCLMSKLIEMCAQDIVNHNKKFLSRVYPNTTRVDSSNYNPQDLWNCGCQIVSMNFQSSGLMMDLCDGRFKQNGACGYVLKPSVMREEISYFTAATKEIIPGVPSQILHIKIISGQQFPKPKGSKTKGDAIDPYVSMEIFGIPADCGEQRTKTVPNNGFNPVFDESFEFTVNLPELALVRFVVLDDDYIGDEFIGQYTIPFECLQPGYRHIKMLSNSGEVLEGTTLFVHIAITNRRGGGKPTKRGMSVKKSKRSREYTSLRTVGVKCVDETFKNAGQHLKEATDLKENTTASTIRFKENCGLASIANIKQCIRVLATRLQSSSEVVKLTFKQIGGMPYLHAEGGVPDMLKKALTSFEQMVTESKFLISKADEIVEKLLQCQASGLEWHEDLNNLCVKEGLKGRKLSKATENFAWNHRVLKGQADLLARSKDECAECMKQICEAATALGFAQSEDSDKQSS